MLEIFSPGTWAVIFGLVLFFLGYYKGKSTNSIKLVEDVIDQLISDGYIKTERTLVDGKWELNILRHDEE